MKILFYNPLELPSKVRVTSSSLGVDKTFEAPFADANFSPNMDELFAMAKCGCFDDVAVYFTSHNEAYTKPNRNSTEKTPVSGWVSLKEVKKGGGYLGDKVQVRIE